jgi:hypothetical protein
VTRIIEHAPVEHVPPELAASKARAVVEAMQTKLMEEDGSTLDLGIVAVYSCIRSRGGMDLSERSKLGASMEECARKQL